MKILLVEPDQETGRELVGQMRSVGMHPSLATTSERAMEALHADTYDVVLLNHMLPDISGQQWLSHLQTCRRKPAIVFPACGEDGASTQGAAALLLERLRPAAPPCTETLLAGDLSLNVRNHEVWRAGTRIALTDKEFRLLRLLLENRGEVVRRDTLLSKVWGYAFDPRTNLIEVHISKLRSKIDHPFHTKLVKTVRSNGYLIH